MTLPSARALSRSIFEGSNGPVSGAAEADRPTLMRAGPAASAFSTVRRGNFCIVYLPFAAFREERHGCRHIAGDPLGMTPAIGTEPQRARVEGLHVNVRTSIPFRTREDWPLLKAARRLSDALESGDLLGRSGETHLQQARPNQAAGGYHAPCERSHCASSL